MNNIEFAVQQLSEAIKASAEYREYQCQLEKVKQVPGLKEEIDAFRAHNFQIQTSDQTDFRKIDEFEKQYAGFRENPLVSDFLAAELGFCRMMQDINIRITETVNFE